MAYVDELLPETTFDFLQLALWSVAIVILVCSLDPYTLLAVSPAIVVIIWMRSFNLQASREIKRVEAKHRSPIYAHVSRTIDGLFVLHSFPGKLHIISCLQTCTRRANHVCNFWPWAEHARLRSLSTLEREARV